jgi:hypothetical protein
MSYFLNCSAWKSAIYDGEQVKKYDTEFCNLHLFDWLGVTNVANSMRTLAAYPIRALRLFLLSLERIK